ncbi:unnamed protein product [Lupinus luteus]|uniref:Pentatricopeptide repeat-containing protein n=1 Tax=Lupinus luteus TaxID=3873 RepID=A0AAV1X5G0_LUPLU
MPGRDSEIIESTGPIPSLIVRTKSITHKVDRECLTLLTNHRLTKPVSTYSTSQSHIRVSYSDTTMSRLSLQLTHQNLLHSRLSRMIAMRSRIRKKSQTCLYLFISSLGLLIFIESTSKTHVYSSSTFIKKLKENYIYHKKWHTSVVSLSDSGHVLYAASLALRLFKSVTRRLRKFPDPDMAAESRPDTAAFNAALNACANLGDSKIFLMVFDEMPEWGVVPDALSYNILIKLCCRIDRKNLLVFVLERVLQLGIPLCITTLHSLVAAYVDFGDLETAEKIVQSMREQRRDLCKILRETESNLLQDLGTSHDDDEEECVMRKLLPNLMSPSGNGPPLLAKAYAPDTRIYTSLMKGYMKAGRVADTVRMLEAMRHQDDSASHPDHVSYTTVVSALVKTGSMDRARQVLSEMLRIGVAANRITYNILLKGYCKQLQMDKARELLKEMIDDAGIQPDVVSYNTLIDGCILVDDSAGALAFFNEMRARGITPTKISYTTLMKAFAFSGQPKLANKVFDEMINDRQVKVDVIAWNMLVEGYCRLGLVEEAKKVIQKMKENGFHPDVGTYGSLANGIALARRPGEALLLWNEVKERCEVSKEGNKTDSPVPPLKPDEGLLDTLADICVRAAFFRKALEIVACMEENGISPNKTKFTRIYVEMHSRMFTSKHASMARQQRRVERKRAAEAFKFWLGLPNSYYGSEWRLEPMDGYE